MWFLFALLAIGGIGAGQVLIKKGYEKLSPAVTYFLDSLVCFPVWLPFIFWLGGASNQGWPLSLLAAVLISISFPVYLEALRRGKVSLAGTVISTSPIYTAVLAFIFLQERLNSLQSLAVVSVILGVLLLPACEKPGTTHTDSKNWLGWGIAAAVALGISDVFVKAALNSSSVGTYLSVLLLVQLAMASFYLRFKNVNFQEIKNLPLKYLRSTLLGLVIFNLGAVSWTQALFLQKATLVIPIMNAYTVVTVILARVFLKEKINRLQFLGIFFVFSALILLGLAE